MKTLALFASLVLAGCLGDTTPRSIPGVQPDKSPPQPLPLGGATALPIRSLPDGIVAHITEELDLPAGATIDVIGESNGELTVQTVTTLDGDAGTETCRLSVLDNQILSAACTQLLKK